jgi:hypothetical protein
MLAGFQIAVFNNGGENVHHSVIGVPQDFCLFIYQLL